MKEEIPGKRRKVERNNNGRTIKDAPVIIYMVYESQSCRSNMPFNTKAEVLPLVLSLCLMRTS